MNIYEFPKWLFNFNVSADAKILYVYLYNLIKDSSDESIYITSTEIEKKLHLTQFKRRKILNELKDCGLIKRTNRGTKTKTYIYIPEMKEEIEMEDDTYE